jgi:hypothetical protein
MRRTVMSLAIAGLFGLVLSAGHAQACHRKSRCAEPCAPVVKCAPAPICKPAPVCEPAPCKKRKSGCGLLSGGLFKGHRKAKSCHKPCAEPCGAPACGGTVHYAVAIPSGQAVYAAPQGMPVVPSKQVH